MCSSIFFFQGGMMSICFKEGIKVPPEALNDIITGANHDIRQVLHHLSLWSVKDKELSIENIKEESQKAKKDIKLVSVLFLKLSGILNSVL
jgi:replication factor C subunit 1